MRLDTQTNQTRLPDIKIVDCPHGGRHKHGTVLAYHKDNCRCGPCRTVHARRTKEQSVLRSQGLTDTPLDADETIARMDALREQGMSVREIADAAGLHHMTLHRVYRTRRISTSTHNKVMAVTYDPPAVKPPRRDFVPVHGTRLRLQALIANGWPVTTIAEYLSTSTSAVNLLINPDAPRARDYVTAQIDRKVRTFFDNYWDAEPPARTFGERRGQTVSRRLAIDKGWVPPMGLDEDRIDDPTYTPNPNASRRER